LPELTVGTVVLANAPVPSELNPFQLPIIDAFANNAPCIGSKAPVCALEFNALVKELLPQY
jgi:hypothetical protein